MDDRKFSNLKRSAVIKKMEQEHFDVLVIGGGITGCGIALDAVTRGLKVGLIEQKDFASGTSSRSGKLIHGGLKYLKNFEFSLVKEVGRERDIVYRNARHLVYPIKMSFPLIKGEPFNKITLKIGLSIYDRLAGVKKEERHTLYSKRKALEFEPLFNKDTIQGSGAYVEYRTDDSRLTMEVAKTAFENGAFVLNYAEMTKFLRDKNNFVSGVEVTDHLNNTSFNVKATYVVNAAGPWVDAVRKKDRPIKGKYMVHAKGIHIVFDYKRVPVRSSIYFQHKGRMIAVIPKRDCTYVGSTESVYKEDLDDIHVHKSEVKYLLKCLNDVFPSLSLSEQDIMSSWAGVRPLIGEDGHSPAELSRHDEIFESESGLITIAGGKLTGYRKMAERVMEHIDRKGSLILSSTKTDKLKLSGGKFHSSQQLTTLVDYLFYKFNSSDLSKEEITEYVYRYGSNTEKLLKNISAYNGQFPDKESRNIAAEAKYTVENEQVATLADFYDRRTSYLLFDRGKVKRTLPIVTAELTKLFRWSEEHIQKETNNIKYLLGKTLTFVEG